MACRVCFFALIVFACPLNLGAHSDFPSLMFTANEMQAIESSRLKEIHAAQNGPAISCDAILYMDPQNWTIWVNGQKITSAQKHPEFQVVSVKEGQVELLWKTKGQAMPVILGVGDMQLAQNLDSKTQLAKR